MANFTKFSDGLTIFAKYCPDGMNEEGMIGTDHDVIYVYVSQDDLDPESDDGEKLQVLGFEPHEGGNWAFNV